MNTRHELLAQSTGLGGPTTALSACVADATATEQSRRASGLCNFVLVHGAWHGGWCYRRVADLLRAQGHHVETPTLTGLGERYHLTEGRINCSTHVQDVINVIRWERLENVILCGHSYGGMVIAGVADAIPESISALVYLDCPIPENGKSLFDLVPQIQAPFVAETAAYGGFLVKPPAAKAFNVNLADQAMVDSLLTPHPLASFCEPLALTGAHMGIARKIFVEATNGSYRAPSNIREDKQWEIIEVSSGHSVMIDAPAAVSDALLAAASPKIEKRQ